MNIDFTGIEQTVLLLIAVGLAIGITVGIAGTPFYPIAYAMVIVALVYVIANGGDAVVSEVQTFLAQMLG